MNVHTYIPPVLDSRGRIKANRSKTSARKPSKFVLEPIEPRVLLSADTLVPGLQAALETGLVKLGDKVTSVIQNDTNFNTSIPGILQFNHDVNGTQFDDHLPNGTVDDKDVHSPNVHDILSINVDRNLDGSTPSVGSFASLAARYNYISGLSEFDSARVEEALKAMDINNDGLVDPSEIFKTLVVGAISSFLSSYNDMGKTVADLQGDFTSFLSTLKEPDVFETGFFHEDLIDLSLGSVTQNPTSGLFGDSFTIGLKIKDTYFIDLGLSADQSQILIPNSTFTAGDTSTGTSPGLVPTDQNAANNDSKNIQVTGSLNMPLNFDFNISPVPSGGLTASNFNFLIPSDIKVGVDADRSLKGLITNVGFLGMDVAGNPADSHFTLKMEWDLHVTDPSSPINLGFTQSLPVSSNTGIVTAATPLPNDPGTPYVFPLDVTFDVKVGEQTNPTPVTVTVTAGSTSGNTSATDLVNDVQSALNSAGLGMITAKLDGSNKLQLVLDSTDTSSLDITPLGFSGNQLFDGSTLTATGGPTGAAAIGSTAPATIKFLLSLGGAIPVLVTVHTTPGDDTAGKLTLAGLVVDINTALTAASLAVMASDNGSGEVQLSAGSSLEVTKTLKVDAKAGDSITYDELNDASFSEFIKATQNTGVSNFSVDMPLAVRPGIDFTPTVATAGHTHPELILSGNPFTMSGPVGNVTGNARFDIPLVTSGVGQNLFDFDQLLDFNVMGPGEVVSLIQQLQGWANQLDGTALLSNFKVPFAQAVLGKFLSFDDLIHDTLLTNDKNTPATTDDEGRLLSTVTGYDPNTVLAAFATAQELGARLAHMTETDPNAPQVVLTKTGSGAYASYDPVAKQLTYNLALSEAFVNLDVPVNFSADLTPLSDVTSQSKIELQGAGKLNTILGFQMGPAQLKDATLLSEINGGGDPTLITGTGVALTGASDVSVISGRLSDDATFDVSVTTGSETKNVQVTVTKLATADNTTVDDLVADINTALQNAKTLPLLSSTVNINTLVQAASEQGRIILKAVNGAGVVNYSVTSSTADPAYSQLGLATTAATTVALTVTPTAGTVSVSSDTDLQFYLNGSGSFTKITLKSASTGSVPADSALTGGNANLTDLVNDINSALLGTNLVGKIVAARNGNNIVFAAVDGSVTSFRISATGAGSSLGLGTDQKAGVFLIAPNAISSMFGKLTSNASFSIALDTGSGLGSAVAVSVNKSATDANASLADLINDINTAIGGTTLGGKVMAFDAGNFQIGFQAIDQTVQAFQLTAPASNELGFATTETADAGLKVTAIKSAPSFYGPRSNAMFTVNVTGGAAAGTYDITLNTADTVTNGSISDLVADLRRAFNDAIGVSNNPFVVSNDGNRILLSVKATSGVTAFTITADVNNAATTDLKLYQAGTVLPGSGNVVSSADTADMLIYTQDGNVWRVSLDGKTDIGGVRAAINALSGSPVTATINSSGTGLTLKDSTSGSTLFRVDSVNGSHAAQALGIFATDTNFQHPIADGQIDGAVIATTQLIDRLLIEKVSGKPFLSADVHLVNTSDKITVDGNYGFVGVELSNGTVSGFSSNNNFSLDLQPPAAGTQITLSELIGAVGHDVSGDGTVDAFDLTKYVTTPTLTLDGKITFNVALSPSLSTLTLGGGPQISFNISSSNPLFFPAASTETFNPASDVNTGSDVITLTNHQLNTGDPIVYHHGAGGTDIGGLVDGQTYFVIKLSNNTLQLAKTLTDATGATTHPVNLTSAGTGTAHELKAFQTIDPTLTVSDNGALGDLANFKSIDFSDIVTALQGAADFLNGFSSDALPFLGEKLPLLGISISDLANVAKKFDQAVQDIVKNPAGSLQTLEQKIRETFGLPAGPSIFQLSLVDNNDGDGNTTDMLEVKLDLNTLFSKALSVDLDLGNVGNAGPIHLLGTAGINASGSLDAKLAFGVDLDAPTDPSKLVLFTADTGITAHLGASADNVTFNVSLGPLGGFISGGNIQVNLDAGLTKKSGAPARVTLSDALTEFDPSLTGSIKATLPVFFPTESNFVGDIGFDGTLSLDGSDGLQIGGAGLTIPDGITNLDFSSFNLLDNLPLVIDGGDIFLSGIQDILDGQIFGIKLPFIGDKLAAGAQFIENLRENFIQPFRDLVQNAPDKGPEIIQGFLFDLLGPSGLNLLLDPTTHMQATSKDAITITSMLTGPLSGQMVQWDFELGQTYSPNINLGFDLGFPGLNLKMDGNMNINLGWKLDMGLGISIADGPYIDIAPSGDATANDFTVFADVNFGSSTTLTGTLGFLELQATQNNSDFDGEGPEYAGDTTADPTKFHIEFGVNLINSETPSDTRLSFYELGNLGAKIGVLADAEINLNLVAEFSPDLIPATIAAAMPKVRANFLLDWDFSSNDLTSGADLNLADGLKLVEFKDVGVDLGSFLSDTVGPIIAKIQEVTGPLQPIIDVMTARIPVLSDLAGRTVTLVDIASAFGDVDTGMIYAIADIINLVNSIHTSGVGSLFLTIGSFKLVDASNPSDSLLGSGTDSGASDLTNQNFDFGSSGPLGDASSFADKISGLVPGLGDLTNPANLDGLLGGDSGAPAATEAKTLFSGGFSSTPDKSGFDFPIFKNPSQIFGLLLGRPATLITYDLPPFSLNFKYEQSFEIYGPLFGLITAGIGFKVDLAFGYDTQGISDFAAGGFQNPLDLLSGFYISDTDHPDGTGVDVPEMVLTGSLGVGAELNLGIASAGVTANIILTVNFDLYDPNHDGKVRIKELLGNFLYEAQTDPLLAPLAIFDINTDLAFQLSAFIQFLFARFDFNITPQIVLFQFSIPFDRAPILATERGDGSVLLNIGPNASARLNGDVSDGNETIFVGDAPGGKVAVWGMGVSESAAQIYSVKNGKGVVGIGGDGNDTIDASKLTTISVSLEGGSGNDTLIGGGGNDIIKGDAGDDSLVGNGGNDTITGGDGNDIINGGAGNDIIFGDSGTVSTDPTTGSIQSIVGLKDGNDTINGGLGNDTIFGGGGDDTIGGDFAVSMPPGLLDGTGGDDDVIFGDGGRIAAPGGVGDLSKVVNADGTLTYTKITLTDLKGGGNDTIQGHGGKDVIFGGAGNDSIDGGDGDDTLFGGPGFDTISGAGGADSIFGGTEDDRIFGFRDESYAAPSPDGGDKIWGQEGNDFIRGNAGNDTIYGGAGADIIFGDQGDDTIYGENEPDIIFGGPGNDYIDGGASNDIVFGDDGVLVWVNFDATGHKIIGLVGNTADVLEGQSNATLDGIDSTIRATADSHALTMDLLKTEVNGSSDGNDTVIGGAGDDSIFGGAKDDTLFGDFNPSAPPTGPIPAGADILIGDGGRVQYFNRRLDTVSTVVATTLAETGADSISGNGGNDLIFGGGGNDTLYGRMDAFFTSSSLFENPKASDNDIMVGDDGEIDYAVTETSSIISKIFTTISANATATGGTDTAYGNAGDDIIFGGMKGDNLQGDTGGDGNDVIIGDNGEIDYTADGLYSKIFTTDTTAATGGIDTIQGQDDADLIFGGVAGDIIDGNQGNDIIVGDEGEIDFMTVASVAKITLIKTTDTNEIVGGADTIQGDEGSDVIIGGVNNGGIDMLYGDRAVPTAASNSADGTDIILGDDGELNFTFGGDANPDTLDLIRSYHDGLGGSDQISGNAANDVLIGGNAGDTMYGDNAAAFAGALDGEDIMIGDNADIFLAGTTGRLLIQVAAMPAATAVDLITTTDTSESTGGADTMSGNAKADIMLGGVNADTMYGDQAVPNATTIANDGDDIMLGDNGLLDFTYGTDTDRNTLDLIRSAEDGLGGNDVISGNKGADVEIGGTGNDTIYGDDANFTAGSSDLGDILIGDNADIFLVAKGSASGGDLKTVLGSAVATIRTTDTVNPAATGGSDTISGNAGGDIIFGGVKGDFLYGDRAAPTAASTANDGNDIMLGDNGAMEWLSTGRLSDITGIDIGANNPALYAKYSSGTADTDLTTLDLITTEQPTSGGRDLMYGDEGKDVMFGGTDADEMHGDDGNETGTATNNDLMFGDNGRLYPQFSALTSINSRNFFSIDTGQTAGGEGDLMFGEEGNDIMLGGQGDDRMFGGSGDDDMTGGHNVAGGWDELGAAGVIQNTIGGASYNDLMDGGTGNDTMAGDNAIIWRRGDDLSPRFQALTGATIYTTTSSTITANVSGVSQSDPADAVGRDIQLLDHSFDVQGNPQGRYGNDIMAGGADNDTMFGELGNDIIQGDGSIGLSKDPGPNTATVVTTDSVVPANGGTRYFNVPEAATDGDDYIEGNGGNDLIYGGLGQDDIIGGSSDLFGLTTSAQRPDGSDTIFGGAGIQIDRNNIGAATQDANNVITATPTGDARDADYIMGDNADIYRLVKGGASGTNPNDPKDVFLTFNYDNYTGGLRIIPRAMKELDYTLGGADFAGGSYTALGAANNDNGAADVIHGESGDDVIFGMTGSDVLFGDGQDDDIVGGYGNDWISGGTGQDGILGDDGLIYTSRNGTAEPLYGIAATTQQTISTPGGIQSAVINPTGQLNKAMELVPFSYDPHWNATDDEFPDNANNTPFADDIIFGGLGSDSIHGGSGDDAISGAEALADAYVPTYDASGNPTGILDLGYSKVGPTQGDPGNVLAFNPIDLNGQHLNNRFRAGEFALYDEYDPLREVQLDSTGNLWKSSAQGTAYDFLLDFNQDEGVIRPAGSTKSGGQTINYPSVHDDGADVLFGDNGNDWLVGGTGNDDMYGGWGNDLLNADDNQTTDGRLNDQPDTAPTYEDRAYGGAGRDVLIGNTGGDRLIDWVGEYNSYLVPYAPFGEASVSRTLQPQLQDFLYALSKADGADQSQIRDFAGGSTLRNGEPGAELGLVLQKDFAWQAQTGAPSDPQAGNIPGGQRDVLRSANFTGNGGNNNQAQGFFVDSGNWTVSGGRYQVSPTTAGGEAVSVFYVDDFVPNYFEILATVNAAKPTGGASSNAYVIFDYQSSTDFKFAGIDAATNKLEIGHHNAQGWVVDVQAPYQSQIKSATDYNLFLSINGSAVTLTVNNLVTLSYAFAPRVDALGISHGINDGMVGLGANNATAQVSVFQVQKVAPVTTLNQTVDFSNGTTSLFDAPLSGTWAVGSGRYAGTPGATPAIDTVAFNVGQLSTINLSATLKVTGEGGFVYDEYAANDFKYVSISAGKITLGHRTSKGWFTDAVVSNATIVNGTDYKLGLTLLGTTASVTLNGSAVASFVYNSIVTDGNFGLLSRTGTTSFDSVTVQSDDPSLSGKTFPSTVAPAGVGMIQSNAQVDSLSVMPSINWDADWASNTAAQESIKGLELAEVIFAGIAGTDGNSNATKEDALESQEQTDWYVEV